MSKPKKLEPVGEKPSYQPTERERPVLRRQFDRLNDEPPIPRMKVITSGGGVTISA